MSNITIPLITEDRILRNTYLYENIMFTNKVKTGSRWESKRVGVNYKSKINAIVWGSKEGCKGCKGADAIKKFTPSLGIPYLGV